jgi:peptidoglycan/LPS O-acetylase OafA/YrhL
MIPDPQRNPRYPMLDLWRGVACLMVVLHHSGFALGKGEAEGSPLRLAVVWFVRQMDLGVPLFFVISGYCIVASMDGIRRRNAGPWTFLRRRVRRIYPPYWASLLIFVAILWSLDHFGFYRLHDGGHSLKLLSPGALEPAQWVGNVTLTETWRPRVFGGPPMEVYTRVAWSLCYEEQFYLLCFLSLLVAPRRLFRGLAILTVAILAFRLFAYDSGRLFRYEGMFPILWHEFAIGIAVYWRLVHAQSAQSKRTIEALVAVLLAIGLASGFRSTIVAAGFGLALIALRRSDAAVNGLSWLGPLRACGRRSYSIYLVHLPICTVGNELLVRLGMVEFWSKVFVLIPLVSFASVAFGWLCFALVEAHFLNPPSDHRPHARVLAGEEPIQVV